MSFEGDAFGACPICAVVIRNGKIRRGRGVANRVKNSESLLPVSMSVSVRATKPPNQVAVIAIEPKESTGHEMNPMLVYWRVVWCRALILKGREVDGGSGTTQGGITGH
jgi:hypothetical protein